jgi:phage gp46-like protein
MDFQVRDVRGIPNLYFTKNNDIMTSIILSLHLPVGRFFFNPAWGHQLYSIKKVNDPNLAIAQQYVKQALQWLIDLGKISSLNVLCERDDNRKDQINIKVNAVQPTGSIITYKTFKRIT